MRFIATFLDAVFAARCLICNQSGKTCCDDGWQALPFRFRSVVRSSNSGITLHGFAAIDFETQSAALIHRLKDDGLTVLAERFAEAVAGLVLQMANQLQASDASFIYLVPVPSRVSSIQQRGFTPATVLARAVIGRIQPRFKSAASSNDLRFGLATNLVWHNLESTDQAMLNKQERNQNLQGVMKASKKSFAKRIILVDDVVTTGASLLETARALSAEGAEVIGFVTFAETILRKNSNMLTREQKKV